MLGWTNDLPDWMQSRKFVWGVVTFLAIIVLATLGTVLAWLFDIPTDLFTQAMYLVTGGGATGVTTQAVVDREIAKNTQTQKVVAAPPPAPEPTPAPATLYNIPPPPYQVQEPPKPTPKRNSLFGG